MGVIQQLLAAYSGGGGGGPPPLPTVTWNPSDKDAEIILSDLDLKATKGTSNALKSARATRSVAHSDTTGYYFEVVMFLGGGTAPYALIGLATSSVPLSSHIGAHAGGYAYYQETGQKWNNNAGAAFGSAYATGDVIGVAFKGGKVWFSKNGVWQGGGDPAAGTGEAFTVSAGDYFPGVSLYRYDGAEIHVAVGRFKASAFSYSPPTGFTAWGA